jgi:RNA polymerase sigma-70 factor (ECF subfamily)
MIVLLQVDRYTEILSQVKPALTGVEDTFKQYFEEYFEKLYHYAFTIVRDNDEAKDIVQTAFVKLWEKRNEVNLFASAKSYLYTSVYHLSLNSIRNNRTRAQHRHKLISTNSGIDANEAEERETRKRIQLAIDTLPEKCKEVFFKSRMEGKKYASIADELNISVKTVEAQIGKALKILREQLADLIVVLSIILFNH